MIGLLCALSQGVTALRSAVYDPNHSRLCSKFKDVFHSPKDTSFSVQEGMSRCNR